MLFLFENIFGILLGIFMLSLAMCINGIMKDATEKQVIVDLSISILWYLITVAVNRFFPNLGILYENKVTYFLLSAVISEIISLFIKAHIYEL